jgi:hypothetical protein
MQLTSKSINTEGGTMKTRIVFAMALIAVMALTGVVTAASVEPIVVDPWPYYGCAADECAAVACCDSDFHYRFDDWYWWEYNGFYTPGDGNTIEIFDNDGSSFNWASEWPVSCVIVVDGTAANVYCYDEPAYGDTDMSAPTGCIDHVTFCYNEPEECYCYQGETAWAEGARYVPRGNWAMYVDYYGVEKTVNIIAAQYVNIGSATFSAPVAGMVTVTINLTGGAIFYGDDDNLKIQDYDAIPPAKNPAPGRFDWKWYIAAGGTTTVVEVPLNNYYGIHLDVGLPVPCE